MKTLGLLLLTCLTLGAAPPLVSIPLGFKWQPGPGETGGLTTNDYMTNIVFNLLSTTDVTTPTNQWPVLAVWPATFFTNQGPAGSTWTNTVVTSDQSRFFAIVVSNITAWCSSPFSNLCPWFQVPTNGVLLPLRR